MKTYKIIFPDRFPETVQADEIKIDGECILLRRLQKEGNAIIVAAITCNSDVVICEKKILNKTNNANT